MFSSELEDPSSIRPRELSRIPPVLFPVAHQPSISARLSAMNHSLVSPAVLEVELEPVVHLHHPKDWSMLFELTSLNQNRERSSYLASRRDVYYLRPHAPNLTICARRTFPLPLPAHFTPLSLSKPRPPSPSHHSLSRPMGHRAECGNVVCSFLGQPVISTTL